MQKQIRKNQAKRRQKELAVVMALVNGLNTTAPLVLPLTAVVPEMPKARQETVGNLLTTSFNRGGQLLDSLFFTTAYAETIGDGESITTKNVDSYTADSDVINSGGRQNVYDTGSATNTTINNSGNQVVYSGGGATTTTIDSGGNQVVATGGTATGTDILSGGNQYVSGGNAVNTVVSAGGAQTVYDGGSATGTTVASGGSLSITSGAFGGATATGVVLNDGYVLNANTGVTLETTTPGVGIEAGTATGLTLNSGGRLDVLTGHTASGTTVNSGGTQYVSIGGSATNTVINSSGMQLVYDGGTAINTTVNGRGQQIVNSGGTVSGGTVSGGVGALAEQLLHGNSNNVIVHNYGYQSVQATGIATGTELYGNGQQDVYGTANSTYIHGAAQYIQAGGIASGTEIVGNGRQYVSSGGIATDTAIYTGFQEVLDGGRASGTTIHDGNQTVSGGGQAFHTTISGGTQEVKTNARAYNTTISGGTQNLSGSSSLAEITVIHSGGTQEVGSIAVAHRTTISAGGRQIFNEGFARNTIIDSGGVQELDNGNADLTTILAGGVQNIISAGAATNTTIHSGGVQNVYYGGIAGGQTEISSDVTLDGSLFLASGTLFSGGTTISGGTQNVLGGSADGTVILSGGTQAVSSGSATNTTIHNGGTQSVYRGTMVSNSTVNAGGVINLVQSGAALQGDTTLNQGTIQIFNPASGSYEISRLVINSGGTVKFSSTVGNQLTIDELQGAASFVINTDLAHNASDHITISSGVGSHTLAVAYDPSFLNGTAETVTGTASFANAPAGTSFTAVSEAGGYSYRPLLAANSEGTIWSVTGFEADNSGPAPGASTLAYNAAGAVAGGISLWRQENNSLTRRLGELRNGGKGSDWARIYKGELETNSFGRRVKQQYTAIQGGHDTLISYQGRDWYAGYTLGYLDASGTMPNGGGDASSLTAGAYAAWLGDKGHYLDLIFKAGRLKNDFFSYDVANVRSSGGYHTWGASLSAEYGYRKQLPGNWYVEPQSELTMSRMGSADYNAKDTNGNVTRINQDGMNSVVGRLGVAVGRTVGETHVYAKTSLVREFNATAKATVGGKAMREEMKDNWLELAVGVTGAIGTRTDGYLELSRTTGGDKTKTPWQVNLGARWKF